MDSLTFRRHWARLNAALAVVMSVFCISLALSACHAPATIVTAPGKAAFTADQIVIRVNELQKAAIQAEAAGGLTTAQARVLVDFSVSANKILKATPDGWRATVIALWTETKKKLTITNPTIAAAMVAVDVILGGV